MPLDVDNLPKEITELMKKLIRESKADDKERGFLVCEDLETRKIKTVGPCVGEFCYVEQESCPPGDKQLLDFHTHPDTLGPARPTENDLILAIRYNSDISCVGSPAERSWKTNYHDWEITCYNLQLIPRMKQLMIARHLEQLEKIVRAHTEPPPRPIPPDVRPEHL